MKRFDVPSFKINGETIQEVYNVNYLGHLMSNRTRTFNRQCRQLYTKGMRTFYMCSTEVKVNSLRTFYFPTYTAQLCWNFTLACIHTLHVAYNNLFRLLLHQPKYRSAATMFVEYNVPK